MLFKNIGMIDENFAYREGMYVGTDGDRITYIGKEAPSFEGEAREEELFKYTISANPRDAGETGA